MPNWYDSFAIVVLFIFFIELLIARRIFRTARKNSQLESTQQNQMFVFFQPSNSQNTIQYNTINGRPINAPQQPAAKFILARPQQPPRKTTWRRFSITTCLGTIFLITYLTINYLLRPFTNAWGLYLLPILIPLPFLALPSLLQSKTFTTIGFLFCGFGLGFLLLFLL